MELDIRDLIKVEVGRRGLTLADAGREVRADSNSYMVNMLNGSSSLSVKMLLRIIKTWRIDQRRELLQVWLAAYIRDKFGEEFIKLVKRAGWLFDLDSSEVPAVEEGEDYTWMLARFSRFGATAAVRKRRMELLNQIAVATKDDQGFFVGVEYQGFSSTVDICRGDLKLLERLGLVKSSMVRAAAVEERPGNPKRRCWRLTQEGISVLAEARRLAEMEGRLLG